MLTTERLDAAPELRAVFHCAGSVRPIVSEAVWQRGLLVTSAAEANATPVAEYTLAAIIFAGKKAHLLVAQSRRAACRLVRRQPPRRPVQLRTYHRDRRVLPDRAPGRDRLWALDTAEVLVTDPYADPGTVAAAGGVLVELEGARLSRAETLSLALPVAAGDAARVSGRGNSRRCRMVMVINTARGLGRRHRRAWSVNAPPAG